MPYTRIYAENDAFGRIETELLSSPSDVTIQLQSWQWERFWPSAQVPFNIVVYTINELGARDLREMMVVTARSWDTLTVTRASESIPQSFWSNTQTQNRLNFPAWSYVELVNSAAEIQEISRQIAVDDNTTDVVHKTWEEIITWNKTFHWNNVFNADDFQWYDEDVSLKLSFTDNSFATKLWTNNQIATAWAPYLFGDGSDGDLFIVSWTFSINNAQIYNFNSVTIEAWATINSSNSVISPFVGTTPFIPFNSCFYIKCRWNFTNNWTVDFSWIVAWPGGTAVTSLILWYNEIPMESVWWPNWNSWTWWRWWDPGWGLALWWEWNSSWFWGWGWWGWAPLRVWWNGWSWLDIPWLWWASSFTSWNPGWTSAWWGWASDWWLSWKWWDAYSQNGWHWTTPENSWWGWWWGWEPRSWAWLLLFAPILIWNWVINLNWIQGTNGWDWWNAFWSQAWSWGWWGWWWGWGWWWLLIYTAINTTIPYTVTQTWWSWGLWGLKGVNTSWPTPPINGNNWTAWSVWTTNIINIYKDTI